MGSFTTQPLIICSQPGFSPAFRELVLVLGFHLDQSKSCCPQGSTHLLLSTLTLFTGTGLQLSVSSLGEVNFLSLEHLFRGWKVCFFLYSLSGCCGVTLLEQGGG